MWALFLWSFVHYWAIFCCFYLTVIKQLLSGWVGGHSGGWGGVVSGDGVAGKSLSRLYLRNFKV